MKNSLLERPRLRSPGRFVLPQIASDIPVRLGKESVKHQVLAKFALAAEAIGIPLPGGNFVSIEEVVNQQWGNYYKATMGPESNDFLAGNLEIVVTNKRLEARIASSPNLVMVQAKPVITALESKMAGLGWYVLDVLGRAAGHAMNVYDCRLLGYQSQAYLFEAESDEEFAKNLYAEEHGNHPEDADIPKLIEAYRDDYAYLPSDVLRQVDGHKHLLGWADSSGPGNRRAFVSKRAEAAFAGIAFEPELAKCVQAAIALDKLFKKDKAHAFSWSGEDVDPEDGEDFADYPEQVGAVCIVAWEETDILLEMIEHSERGAYENGTAYEYQGRAWVPLDASSKEIKNLARDLRDYLGRWNAMAMLVSCFPFAEEQ
ncbi:PRTRC system protein F [Polaromonas sp. AER18D-145]|uniref:PRTRC system protein F n=1 Tax=Polaromonas sp. AER18D-145 TaxID=1977060 RepID=UPI001482D5E7|nr:PRTRC system protein F [Polaromonas sp. AER18D-145]